MSAHTRNQNRRIIRAYGKQGRAAFIAYLTAGDPDPDRTAALVAGAGTGRRRSHRTGLPFSDPIADGPVIQRASDRAFRAG